MNIFPTSGERSSIRAIPFTFGLVTSDVRIFIQSPAIESS
ncbi:hypothetical protein P10159_4804 [Citrobacter portucalensis]|nr:hypothetical protein P10159_4804 [Citrobacter portucalensis]